MLRLTAAKHYVVFKFLSRTRSAQARETNLGKNILFGGQIREPQDRRSLGKLLYDRLRDPARADKIIQICASSGLGMTTRTFLKQSVAVAESLKEKHIRKGDFILIVGNNSLNMNVALTGILILGAVAVPISYFANPDDLRHLLTYIKPKFFICDGQTLFTIRRIANSVLGELDERKICLLNDCKYLNSNLQCFPEFIKNKGNEWDSFKPVEVNNPKDELALVMKSLAEGAADRGVGLTHANLLAVISRYEGNKAREYSDEVILMVQKIIWMSGIYSLLFACCFGSKLVVMSDFEEEAFMKSIQTYKVTTCYLYPLKIWQLYKYDYPETYDTSSLKGINVVGSGVPRALTYLMKEKTGLKIRPAYGRTEMTGIVIEPLETDKEGSPGQLVPMVYAKVVSPTTNEKYGPNTPGELCFKGPTMMKGYVNDEKASRDIIDKDGFLHTGDYGYYDEEGHFFILDKIKEVIKYKNFEVSPIEIEGVLKSLGVIKDCVVSGIAHPEDGHRVVAFVVLQPGKTATADEIKKFIASKLPEHKNLNGGVIFIPKVPRSRESGFIKRTAIKKVLSKYRLVPGLEKEKASLSDNQANQTSKSPMSNQNSPELKK